MSKRTETLCLILARAGSKGLPGKNAMMIAGRPMLAWTIDLAGAALRRGAIDRIAVSTDGEQLARIARDRDVEVIPRPAELADDTATVDAAARHAVGQIEHRHANIANAVILYGNVPVRPADLIDRAVEKLKSTGCDSVQSVAPVGKNHPYWMKTLGGDDGDVLQPFVENSIDRRQNLPPVYMLDGGVIAVSRASLMTSDAADPHAFLGSDRRAIVTAPGSVVDVDEASDAALAEAMLSAGAKPRAAFTIGDHDPTQSIYVIAEIGVNHDGSVDRAIELAKAAKNAGADAIKLQLFDPDLLLSAEAKLAAYQSADETDPHAMLRRLQLPVDAMRRVRDAARGLNVGFIVTPFSLENFDDVRRVDPDAVKIASPDCVNHPLLATMARLGKPMIVSTGTCTPAEVEAAAALLAGRPLALLHCVSAYPVPPGAADLSGIGRVLPDFPWGYSDHTTSPMTGALAVACGARIIEKHLTHDRGAAGPDHAASFDPGQFAEYVRRIRRAEREIAPPADDVQDEVKRLSRQSVCATRDLPAGHVIDRADVTVKRPGTGIAAARLDDVVGATLKRAVKANHLLRDEDLDV